MKNSVIVLLLVSFAAITLSANIGGYSVYLLDEAKNAECAREMLETGNWFTPTFNYELRVDKPPLHYYFMGIAYSLFGVNELSARIFSVLFGVLTLLVIYFFTRFYINQRAAIYSAVVLISSIGFILQFHMAVPDPYLVFFNTAGLLSFYHGIQRSNSKGLIISYCSIGLAILTKGPIGLIIPVTVIAIYIVRYRKESWKDINLVLPISVILTIALPWFVMAAIETDGEWLRRFFFEHNVDRFLSPKEGHGGNFLLTPLFLILMLMPSGLLIVPALINVFKRPLNDFSSFSLIATLVVIVFFSISATKLPNYVSPALPFASILIGQFLFDSELKMIRLWPWVLGLLIISVLIPIVVHSIEVELVSPEDWKLLIGLPVGSMVGLLFILRKNVMIGMIAITLPWVVTMVILFHSIVPRIDKLNPVSLSLSDIDQTQNFAAFHIFNPAFSFYLKKRIEVFTEKSQLGTYLDHNEDVIVLTRFNVLEELGEFKLDTVLVQPDLFEKTRTVILRER